MFNQMHNTMKTIRNTELFEELQAAPRDSDALWAALFSGPVWEGYCRDPEIPVLAGGLDHVEVTKTGVYYYDVGNNGEDNSFVIRRELPVEEKRTSFQYYRKGIFVIPPDDRYWNDWKRALNFWDYPGVYDAGGFVKWVQDYPSMFRYQEREARADVRWMEECVKEHPDCIFYVKDLRDERRIYARRRHMPVGPPRNYDYVTKVRFRK